jgi:hypothetical protein
MGTIRRLRRLPKAALKKVLNNIPRELWTVLFADIISIRTPSALRIVDIYGLNKLSTALLHHPSPYCGAVGANGLNKAQRGRKIGEKEVGKRILKDGE